MKKKIVCGANGKSPCQASLLTSVRSRTIQVVKERIGSRKSFSDVPMLTVALTHIHTDTDTDTQTHTPTAPKCFLKCLYMFGTDANFSTNFCPADLC